MDPAPSSAHGSGLNDGVARDLAISVAAVVLVSWGLFQSGWYHFASPAAASAISIVPQVTCVAPDPVNPGSFIVRFGYDRAPGAGAVTIPHASSGPSLNFVEVGGHPLPDRYGVPVEFSPGIHHDVFAIRALDSHTVTWWLTSDDTRSAVATRDTQRACDAPRAAR